MFDQLTDRLSHTIRKITGSGTLTEKNIKDSLREVRSALLEADVALSVVKPFIESVTQKAIGQAVVRHIDPGQALIKLVQEELTHLMGDENAALDLRAQPPAIILVAGLQGSGKTTTVAKLARLLKADNKSVMVTSADVYRPAAIDQLATLAEQVGVALFPSTPNDKPVDIATAAIQQAKKQFVDVLLIDTAGRLHIDDAMMDEIKALHAAVTPVETLFVVDSMTGQDAANTARAFHEALPLTGVILTKTDGDARGGAALSIRHITGKPIKFIGTGEKIDALEPFHPERVAQRILGMGDIVSLVEEAEKKVDKKKADKLAKKIKKGKKFDLEDFLGQLQQMKNMGGMGAIMSKMPGMSSMMPQAAQAGFDDATFVKMEAIINSMTPKERLYPAILNGSRKRRIAQGSGTDAQSINKLLKQFTKMQSMMRKFKGDKMQKMMAKMQQQMPGGFPQ